MTLDSGLLFLGHPVHIGYIHAPNVFLYLWMSGTFAI